MILLRFIAKRRFNYFDLLCVGALTNFALTTEYGNWWWLAWLPLAIVSALIELYETY